jgi:hypothetical protein
MTALEPPWWENFTPAEQLDIELSQCAYCGHPLGEIAHCTHCDPNSDLYDPYMLRWNDLHGPGASEGG